MMKNNNNNNNNNNNRNKKGRVKKSKYLFRRIAIVSILIMIVWLIIIVVSKGFKDDELSDEPTNNEQLTTESTITTETTETTEITEITEITETTDSTESISSNEETGSSEATNTSSTTESAETTHQSSTQSSTNGGKNMDFTAVSYYIGALETRYQTYYKTHQAMSTSEIVRDVNMNLDYDFYGQIEKVNDPNALSVICNKYYQLPSDFTPEGLKSVPDGYFVADGKTYQLKQNALDAFILMSDAAKKEGLSLRIISAYRSNSYQANLYQKYKNNNGQTAADRFSARPGHSEHETGLAIDINDVAQAFENTDEFTWLGENAHKYGYVLRYPEGMENVTGYMYEPWHYRYLGTEVATQLKNSGLTYDAYYAMYLLK